MNPEQFDMWRAYDLLEPIGLHALLSLIARAAATICQSNGADVKAEHLLPDRAKVINRHGKGRGEPKQSAEDQIEAIRGLCDRHNAALGAG